MQRDGFISYSHQRDVRLAKALQRGLHQLARPWARKPAISIFRDTSSLSANPDLWRSIEQELGRSRYFIYLASPEAAASRWVRKEIDFWLTHCSMDHFLIAVSAGTVRWDVDAGDFDWQQTDALPRILAGKFRSEPLWVDLVEVREREQFSLRQADFRDKVATLASTLHGCSKDALDSEDIRQHRIVTLLRRSAITALSALLATSLAAGGFAWQQRGEALSQARASASQALAARSLEIGDRDPRKAALYALYAEEASHTSESAQALIHAARVNDNVVHHLQGGYETVAPYRGAGTVPTTEVAISRDGSTVAYYSELGVNIGVDRRAGVHVYDVRNHEKKTVLPTRGLAQSSAAFELSADGRILMLEAPNNRIEIWNVRKSKLLRTLTASRGEDLARVLTHLRSCALSENGRWVAATYYAPGKDNLRLSVWDTTTGERLSHRNAPGDDPELYFNNKLQQLTALDVTTGLAHNYSLTSMKWTGSRRTGVPLEDNLVALSDGMADRAILNSPGEGQELWNVVTGERLSTTADSLGEPVIPANNEELIVASEGNQLAVYDANLRQVRILGSFSWPVFSIAASANGKLVVAGSSDGAVSLFSTSVTGRGTVLPNAGSIEPGTVTESGRLAYRSDTKEKSTELWVFGPGHDGPQRIGSIPRLVDIQQGAIASTSDGARVVLQHRGTISLWNPRTGRKIGGHTYSYRHGEFMGQTLYFLPDDTHIVSVWDRGIFVINTETWEVAQNLLPQPAGSIEIALSEDGMTLAAVESGSHQVHVWRSSEIGNFEDSVSVEALPSARPLSLTLSRHGREAAIVDEDGRIFFLDTSTGDVIRSSGVTSAVDGAVYSSDTRTFITAAQTGLEFWATGTGDALGSWSVGAGKYFEGDTSGIQSFPAPGRGVVTLHSDGRLVRREFGMPEIRSSLCQLVDDHLSQRDYERYLGSLSVPYPCRGSRSHDASG